MNLGELYKFINFIADKEVSGQTMTPEQFNLNLKAVNLEMLKLKIGLPEEYQPGMPLPKQALEITQKITEDIRPFKVWYGGPDYPQLPIDSYGRSTFPSDYAYPSSIRHKRYTNTGCSAYDKEYNSLEILFDDQIGDRLANSIKMPTVKDPVCVFYSDYIQFYPTTLTSVDFTYIRKPVTPIFGYTLVDDVPVYNAATSTELEWDEILHVDIARMILSKVGINLKDAEIWQYSETKLQKGI